MFLKITIHPLPENKFCSQIWKIDKTAITFAPSSYTSLIQKGGGTWPCDALATFPDSTDQEKGANSCPGNTGER